MKHFDGFAFFPSIFSTFIFVFCIDGVFDGCVEYPFLKVTFFRGGGGGCVCARVNVFCVYNRHIRIC